MNLQRTAPARVNQVLGIPLHSRELRVLRKFGNPLCVIGNQSIHETNFRFLQTGVDRPHSLKNRSQEFGSDLADS